MNRRVRAAYQDHLKSIVNIGDYLGSNYDTDQLNEFVDWLFDNQSPVTNQLSVPQDKPVDDEYDKLMFIDSLISKPLTNAQA